MKDKKEKPASVQLGCTLVTMDISWIHLSKTLAEAAVQSLLTEEVASFDGAKYIIDVVKGVLCTFRNALVWCGASSSGYSDQGAFFRI